MTNTLRQVTDGDMLTFKNCLDVFIRWYVRNCDAISNMAEVWGEPEEDTLVSILSRGIIDVADQTSIIKEADRNESA